jgi:hypothetical protein
MSSGPDVAPDRADIDMVRLSLTLGTGVDGRGSGGEAPLGHSSLFSGVQVHVPPLSITVPSSDVVSVRTVSGRSARSRDPFASDWAIGAGVCLLIADVGHGGE